MKFDAKTFLLAGTALVAVTAFGAKAFAFDATLTGNVEWGDSGTPAGADGDGTDATAGDNADLSTFDLTVTNDGVNDDGSADTNTFALGTVVSNGGTLTILDGAAASDLVVTVGSFTDQGGGNFVVQGIDANTADVTVAVTGDMIGDGDVNITNLETDAADDVLLTVGGDVILSGGANITAGNGAAATAGLLVSGDTTFTTAVTVTAGDTAGGDATLTLNGASNIFTGDLTLDGTAGAGIASLVLSGSVEQTVTGNVLDAGGNTVVSIDNDTGAIFEGTVAAGSIVIEKTGGDSVAQFMDTVTADITLGTDGNAGDENTVIFDATNADFTFTGAITGTAGEDNIVAAQGGGTVTLTGAPSTANISTVYVLETGTVLTTDQNLTATDLIVGSGATLETTANTLTGNVALVGTLHMDGGDVTGDVDGYSVNGQGTLTVDTTGTVTGDIGSNFRLGAINVGTGAILTTTGDVIATTTTLTGTGTLEIDGGAHDVTTNIVAAADGDGTVNILDGAGPTTITGNIGDSTKAIGALDIAGATVQTVTTTGNLYVDAITVNAADTLSFVGSGSQVVSGTLTGGTVIVGSGTSASDVSFNSAVNVADFDVLAAATARHNADLTSAATYSNAGTAYAGVGATVTATDFDGGGTWYVNFADDGDDVAESDGSDSGLLAATAGAVDMSTGTLVINYTGLTADGTYTFASGTAPAGAPLTVRDSAYLYDSQVSDVGNDLQVVVTRSTIDSAATNPNNVAVGAVLESLVGTTDPQISAAIDNVASATTQEELNEVLESVLPAGANGAGLTGAMNATNNVMNLTSQRLGALRAQGRGYSSGNYGYMDGNRAWGQVYGQSVNQDVHDNIDGYDGDTYGVAVGMDTENIIDGIVGVAFSYGSTSLDGDDANTTETDIDSYQLTAYADYDIDQVTWLSGMVAYAWNDVSTVRHNVGGISGLNASGDYNAGQFTAQAMVGRDYTYRHMVFTPNLLAHWTHFSPDSYTETGAGGLNNVVDPDSVNILELGIGFENNWRYETIGGSDVEPQVHAGYRYDLIGDSIDSTARFTGAGAAYNVQGADPARSNFNVGAGIKMYTTDNWEFTANYDFNFKQDYRAHSAYVRAGVKF